jgi:uncharacterized membrane protein
MNDTNRQMASLIGWTHAIYALHALCIVIGIVSAVTVVTAFLLGWPSIIAVILNYVKRSEVRGTWLESHFRWQIRTFWYGALVALLCAVFVLLTIGLGFLVVWIPLGILALWFMYRIVVGWRALSNSQPMHV